MLRRGRVTHSIIHLLIAALSGALAIILRKLLVPLVGDGIEFAILFPTVMIVAMMYGWLAGLIASAVGLIEAAMILDMPLRSTALGAIMMIVVSFVISAISSRLRQERAHAEKQATSARRAEAALQAANEMLSETNKRKNEFISMLSHEMRNPMTPILLSLDLLEMPHLEKDTTHQALTTIRRQVGYMTRLLDDLLDITRIARGKVSLHQQPLRLGAFIQTVIDDHRALFSSRGIALTLQDNCPNCIIIADRTRLAEALTNLLQNAAKFSSRGDRVEITCTLDHTTQTAQISIKDTGIGIPAELLPRLFEAFMQADRSLDRSSGGLGLGLALVKGLIELHGGTISAHSEGEGKGAEFIIRLPLAASQELPQEPAAPTVGEIPPLRVLLIEDSIDIAETMKRLISLREHQVMIAHSGPDGLKIAKEMVPQVIFCDIGLPGASGYEIARELRADQRTRSCYLVAVSGYGRPEDIAQAKNAGFDEHMTKPVQLASIDQAFARYLKITNDIAGD